MKRISIPIFGLIAIVIVAVLAAIAAGVLFQSQRTARSEQDRLNDKLAAAQDSIQSLNLENNELEWRLEKQMEELETAKVEKKEVLKKRDENLAAGVPRPYQVDVYMGNTRLGAAWVYPQNAKKDPETGLYSFQPALRLDERLKSYFTEYRTNIVERPVADNSSTYNTQNYNYPYNYPYYYYYTYPSFGSFRSSPGSSNGRGAERSGSQPSIQFKPSQVVGKNASPWSSPFTAQ